MVCPVREQHDGARRVPPHEIARRPIQCPQQRRVAIRDERVNNGSYARGVRPIAPRFDTIAERIELELPLAGKLIEKPLGTGFCGRNSRPFRRAAAIDE